MMDLCDLWRNVNNKAKKPVDQMTKQAIPALHCITTGALVIY